jgi:diguanylate cyclase (GGDEF)-like protein/hemerythrin-like metal-binding protein
MAAFVWDESFTTHLESVDVQHRRLVDLINRLGDEVIQGDDGGPEALTRTFEELRQYAVYHFSDEENLMAQAGLPADFVALHHQQHVEFVEQLMRMWSSRASNANAAQVLHGFLSAWLSFHILGHDQEMARQVAQLLPGGSPHKEAVRDDRATGALLQELHNLYGVLTQQNRDLSVANARLEEKVAERTAALEKANAELAKLSRTDGLLGIANRMYFDERLDLEWRRARRERTPLALLMLDVDHFKRYNDAYGHPAGDECLKLVAGAAQSAMRRPADLLARYGGEELAMILPNTGLEGARTVAANILEQLGAKNIPHVDSPVADRVTLSIGVAAVTPDGESDAATLVATADRGLYLAKEGGRNRASSVESG